MLYPLSYGRNRPLSSVFSAVIMPLWTHWHFPRHFPKTSRRTSWYVEPSAGARGEVQRGYFYRAGRGWFTKADGRFIPLTDEAGERFRERKVSEDRLKDASARIRVSLREAEAQVRSETQRDAQVGEVCRDYLNHLKAQADLPSKQGIARTYLDRGRTLFDFCYGLPAKYFCEGDVEKRGGTLTWKERPKKNPRRLWSQALL